MLKVEDLSLTAVLSVMIEIARRFCDANQPPRTGAFLKNVDMLMQHIRTEANGAYPTKVESGWVLVTL